MTDPELLSAAIEASGLSVRRFARDVLIRDPRTVWKWLAGPQYTEDGTLKATNALPVAVRERCLVIIAKPPESG